MSRFAAGLGGVAGLLIGGAGGGIVGHQLMIGRDETDSALTGAILGAGVLVPLLAALGAGCPSCPVVTGVVAGVGERPKISNSRFP